MPRVSPWRERTGADVTFQQPAVSPTVNQINVRVCRRTHFYGAQVVGGHYLSSKPCSLAILAILDLSRSKRLRSAA